METGVVVYSDGPQQRLKIEGGGGWMLLLMILVSAFVLGWLASYAVRKLAGKLHLWRCRDQIVQTEELGLTVIETKRLDITARLMMDPTPHQK